MFGPTSRCISKEIAPPPAASRDDLRECGGPHVGFSGGIYIGFTLWLFNIAMV